MRLIVGFGPKKEGLVECATVCIKSEFILSVLETP